MNDNGYKIMNIGDGQDSVHGNIYIVKANPVQDNGFGLFHSTGICSDTETFFFPDDESLLNQVLMIARGGGIWYPNEDDFREEQILDEEKGRRVKIYRHISFYNDDYDVDLNSGHDVCLIPDMASKIRTLHSQYYQRGWFEEYSFRGYVESLAEGDDVQNFWGWLFGRPDFNGKKPWNLPFNYQNEYDRFLDACDEADSSIS